MMTRENDVNRNQVYTFKELEELGFIDMNQKEFGYMLYRRGHDRLGVKKVDDEYGLVYLKYKV